MEQTIALQHATGQVDIAVGGDPGAVLGLQHTARSNVGSAGIRVGPVEGNQSVSYGEAGTVAIGHACDATVIRNRSIESNHIVATGGEHHRGTLHHEQVRADTCAGCTIQSAVGPELAIATHGRILFKFRGTRDGERTAIPDENGTTITVTACASASECAVARAIGTCTRTKTPGATRTA